MKTKILADFQICISAPLSTDDKTLSLLLYLMNDRKMIYTLKEICALFTLKVSRVVAYY